MKEEKGDGERGGREAGKKARKRDEERKSGNDWAIREKLMKATYSVHELTKNFCSILFLHLSLSLKNFVRKI